MEMQFYGASLNREIAAGDHMRVPGREDHYFSVGGDALRLVLETMNLAGKHEIRSILDLPCGHGRVLRHLRAQFSDASITACDIDRDGVDFCVQTFGARGVYSSEDLDHLLLDGRFDLIFCGSLLTHLDAPNWPRWLSFFNAHLAEGGLLIFTTHGRLSLKLLAEGRCAYDLDEPAIPHMVERCRRVGFAYERYPFAADYGVSISSPSWVVAQIAQQPGLRVLRVTEMGWDEHQDVFGCTRSSGSLPALDAVTPRAGALDALA
jgi:SAM-dependent methyltransferase